MIYSDPTNKQGILDLARYHVKADSNKLPETLGRVFINAALDDYLELALFSAGFWQVDDPNHGDENYTDINLVANTSEYAFPTDLLTLDMVEVQDENDNWTPVDLTTMPRNPSDLKEDGNVGIPRWAWTRGAYLHVFPKPNYNKTGGLRLHHSRAFTYWDGDDGDSPGIPAHHHKYLAIRAAYLYAVRESLKNANQIGELMVDAQNKVTKFYARRNKPVKKRLTVRRTPSY